MDKKSIKSVQENSLLSEYKGILIHDHETSMYNFGTGHGECNVHLLRHLKKNTEDSNNKWSEQLSELLLDMNRAKNQKLSEHIFSCNRMLCRKGGHFTQSCFGFLLSL